MEGGWKYAAASVIGTSHQGSPDGVCQDSHAFAYLEDRSAFVGVVSDGAGSASQSQVGSRSICDLAVETISASPADALFEKTFAEQTLATLRGRLQILADKTERPLRDFACTMLVAIICPERAAFWQIGDGAICFRRRSEERFQSVFWPEKGEYANVTFFVTDLDAKDHLEFDVAETEILELGMFSDGLERLALNFAVGEAHSGFFSGLFPHMHNLPVGCSPDLSAQIAGFLGSERINQRTDDDKTLLLASRAL